MTSIKTPQGYFLTDDMLINLMREKLKSLGVEL